ncbi:ComF family protein [Luteimonas sp. A277]
MPATVNQTGREKVDELRRRIGFWLSNDATRLLWPGRCLSCGEGGTEAIDLCIPCQSSLPWLGPACPRCALPLSAVGTSEAAPCSACLANPPPLTEVHAPCLYAAPIDRLLPRFKFHHDLAAGRLLSQLMAEHCSALPRPDALVPVPLHRARLRQRGYDQALELARPLASALGIDVRADLLRRVRATAQQTRLDAAERAGNLHRAFQANPADPLPSHVVLIDDVMTTGATLHAAAYALRQAGVRRVDAWICARAP